MSMDSLGLDIVLMIGRECSICQLVISCVVR